MLAPVVNDAMDKLTDAYSGIAAIDNFSISCQSIAIAKLTQDPDWLPPVRVEIAMLNQDAGAWQLARPAIWAPVLASFVNYFSTMSGVADAYDPKGNNETAVWIKLLQDTLLPAVSNCLKTCQAADLALRTKTSSFSAVLPQLDKSIQAGWDALGSEEQEMLKLAEQLGGLFQTVQSLGATLDSDIISSGKDYTQTAVTMLYEAAAAGEAAEIPIVGIVVAVFTIGKSFYDIIKDDDELIAAMDQINKVKAALSDEALAVALTKSTLQTLYSLEAQYLALRDAIPELIDLWTTEQSKVEDAINALQAGANPNQYLDLLTLPIALADWTSINDFVGKVINLDATVGQPVTIDIGKAEIRPTLAA